MVMVCENQHVQAFLKVLFDLQKLGKKLRTSVHVIYFAKTVEDFAFLGEFEFWKRQNVFKVTLILETNTLKLEWPHSVGDINNTSIKQWIPNMSKNMRNIVFASVDFRHRNIVTDSFLVAGIDKSVAPIHFM